MIAWLARFADGISLSGWLLGAVALAAAGYVATTQIVLHRRQAALDQALAAAQTLASRNATLTSQLDQVQALNAGNLRILAQMEEDHQRDLGDLGAKLERAQKAGRTLYVVQQENARDPDASRPLGDVCPMLDRYLERVLSEGGAAAEGGGGDTRGGAQAPGQPADLPGRAAGAAAPVGR